MSLKNIKFKKITFDFARPQLAQSMHYIAQISYVLILVYYIKAAKYWDWYLGTIATAYLLNFIGYKFILKKEKIQINISPLIISTSIFIFITGYSFKTYLLAITIAMLIRFFVRINGRHIFNPSAIAIVVMICLGEGIYATPIIALADRQWWIAIIILLGIFTTTFSNRIIASLTYLFGLILFIGAFHFLGSQYIFIQIGTILGFSSLVFTFHVLTDPQTTPNSNKELFFFGLGLAFLDILLRHFFIFSSAMVSLNISTAAFAAYSAIGASKLKKIFTVLVPIIIVFIGITYGYFPRPYMDPMKYNAFEEKHASVSPPFHYSDQTNDLGLVIDNIEKQNKFALTVNATLFNSLTAPVFAVDDIDNDGYFDLMISGSRSEFKLLKNIHGNNFSDVTKQFKISEDLYNKIITSTFVDFNNDGLIDIFAVTSNPNHPFVMLQNSGKYFSDVSAKLGLSKLTNSGRATSISLLDYNLDGFVDILIANYPEIRSIPVNAFISKNFIFSKKPKMNTLLQNNQGENFVDMTNQMNFPKNEFTHTIGIADLNSDGYPDLYSTNDYGRDKVFFNRNGREFENVTQKVLGNIFNRNGMGIDFTDIDGSGFQSIYVSNISSGNNKYGMNYFWNNVDGNQFINKSNDLKIGKCGYSWGPKFFDPDLDGEIDLFVGAGYKNGRTNAWYVLSTWSLMPNFLKTKKFITEKIPHDLDIGGFQNKCLFWKKDNQFLDIAKEAGIIDTNNTRTIALLDMNNNGNPLILTGNFRKPRLVAYKNTLPPKNNWVGLNLIGTISNRNAIGSKIIYKKDGKKFTKELFPTNGVSSLHDRRIIIGIKSEKTAPEIEILWPSGRRQTLHNLEINKYNKVVEKK